MSKIRLHALGIMILSLIITEALSDGQLFPVKVPKSIEFQGNAPLNKHGLQCMLSAVVGHTIDPECPSWPGVKIIDPFNLPKTVLLIRMKDYEGDLEYNLNYEGRMNDLMEKLNSEMNEIESDTLGFSYMSSTDEKLNDDISRPFDLIFIVTENEAEIGKENIRHKRQTESTLTSTKPTLESLNLADDYDENFPVIFNIILWFSVALLFSLIAISMVIGSMDPGRDSIIYRMTSTRMKKDN